MHADVSLAGRTPVMAQPTAAQPFLDEMPDLVVLEIAKFLGPEETTKLSMTCRRLYDTLPKFLVMKGKDFSIDGTGTGYGDVLSCISMVRCCNCLSRA